MCVELVTKRFNNILENLELCNPFHYKYTWLLPNNLCIHNCHQQYANTSIISTQFECHRPVYFYFVYPNPLYRVYLN